MSKEISKPLAFGIIGVIVIGVSGAGYYLTTRNAGPPAMTEARKQAMMKRMQDMQAKGMQPGMQPGMPGGQPGMPGGQPGMPGGQPGMAPGMGGRMRPGMPGMGGMRPGMPGMGGGMPGMPMSGPGAPPVQGSVDATGAAATTPNLPASMPPGMSLPPGVDLSKPPTKVDPSQAHNPIKLSPGRPR